MFLPAGLFRDRFYRPNVVTLMLDTFDAVAALAEAEADARSGRAARPPLAEVLHPSSASASARQRATAPWPDPLSR